MLDRGLACTLASDDPSMFHSFLAEEYDVCRRVLGLDDERLAVVARNGVLASFADEPLKASLMEGISSWLTSEGR